MRFPRPDWGFFSDFFQNRCTLCGTTVDVRKYRLVADMKGKPAVVTAHICVPCVRTYSDASILAKVILSKRGAI